MTTPLFKQDPNDREGGYLVSPPGVLLLCAQAIHDPDAGAVGRERAQRLVTNMLNAARAAGYAGTDVAETVLTGDYPAKRKATIAQEVCNRITSDAYIDAMRGVGFNVLR